MKCSCGVFLWALAGRERYLNILNAYFSFQRVSGRIVLEKIFQSKGKTFNSSQFHWESAWPQLCCGSRLCFLLPGVCRGLKTLQSPLLTAAFLLVGRSMSAE